MILSCWEQHFPLSDKASIEVNEKKERKRKSQVKGSLQAKAALSGKKKERKKKSPRWVLMEPLILRHAQ